MKGKAKKFKLLLQIGFAISVLLAFQSTTALKINKNSFQIDSKESYYFPGGLFDNFTVQWYSKHLKTMKEPSLWRISKESKTKNEVYRFLWLRTFHHPVAVCLTVEQDGTGKLIGKMTSGAGGYAPGTLLTNKNISLTAVQVSSFLKQLEKLKFWEMPSKDKGMGNDGAEWIIEGVKNQKYHLVDRWSPESGEFRKAALMLFQFSELKVDEVY